MQTNLKLCNFYSRIEKFFEIGMVGNWYYKSKRTVFSMIGRMVKMYRSVKEYLDDFSSSTKHTFVPLENLSTVFALYFVILGGIFTVFAIVRCLPKARRCFKIIRSKIRLFWIEWSERTRQFWWSLVNWFKGCFRWNARD